MDYPRTVNELQSLEYLVHDELLVYRLQNIRPDNRVQICLHVLEYQVYILIVLCLYHVQQPDYILVPVQLL